VPDAQISVYDPANTARNNISASLEQLLLEGVIQGTTAGNEMAAQLHKLMGEHSVCQRGSQCDVPLQR
jgi:hypothetical protein